MNGRVEIIVRPFSFTKEVEMPKQDNNAGLGTKGPHKRGEKGGKGGTYKGGASSGGKKLASQGNPSSGAGDRSGGAGSRDKSTGRNG